MTLTLMRAAQEKRTNVQKKKKICVVWKLWIWTSYLLQYPQ